MTADLAAPLLRLAPQHRVRVWGGQRLATADPPIGEAWVAYDGSVVVGGPWDGITLERVAEAAPEWLLGPDVIGRAGVRVPLLVKFLDTGDWLSVQVHPTDADAERLVGPGELGKTEAWHVIEADPAGVGRVGVHRGTTAETLASAIRNGNVLDLLVPHAFQPGQTVLVPAGTLHTIGPGVLLYEVQQASDATFRAWDWDRPAAPDRPLHLEQAIAAADVAGAMVVCPPPDLRGTAGTTVARCDAFVLDLLQIEDVPLRGDTAGRSFKMLTVVGGRCRVATDEAAVELEARETVLVAAGTGPYRIAPLAGSARVLRASVPS